MPMDPNSLKAWSILQHYLNNAAACHDFPIIAIGTSRPQRVAHQCSSGNLPSTRLRLIPFMFMINLKDFSEQYITNHFKLQYFPPSKPRRHALSEAAKRRWWEKYNTEKLRDLIAEHELLRYDFSEEIMRTRNENMRKAFQPNLAWMFKKNTIRISCKHANIIWISCKETLTKFNILFVR